ncbi:uncharacterized protein [Dermacentor albipictus]|uniref:uncharacterized protein n=1 Tax=Dermacentor albipictus TaxID=60249 RepID=UPI0038FCD374
MPGHCCVPRCRGNYDGGERVRVFTFPSDPARRAQWIRAIHRANFTPGKRSVVCERHFKPSDMVNRTSYTDTKTGKVIEVTLKLVRLRPDAVPSILPDCPAYLSAPNATTSREAPDEKRMRREAAALQDAINLSTETHQAEEVRNKIDNFQALLKCIPSIKVSKFWTVVSQHDFILFLNLTVDGAPAIQKSVKVTEDLSSKLYFHDVEVTKLDGVEIIPKTVNDIECLTGLLDAVESCDKVPAFRKPEDKTGGILKLVLSLLEDATNQEMQDEERQDAMTFLKEQVFLLLSKSPRYSSELLVFSSLLFTISPHAYRYLRNYGGLTLPHESTIRRVCNAHVVNPAAEQQDASFLLYAKKLASAMKDHEKSVVLMMDDIHLQAYFDYKGGTIVGTASNTSNAAKTAHVFMIQSLLSSQKSVVHILPVEQINAQQLNTVLHSIINELEKTGLRFIAVITDNNSINRKTMSLFGLSSKVSSSYPHPSDATRPLFFVIDPVHLLKCIRNNWINQKNHGTCMFFPSLMNLNSNPKIITVSFKTLRDLHLKEEDHLIKAAPTLSVKALNPSNMERQNVKLALKVFSLSTIAALETCGQRYALQHAAGTAEFLKVVETWWRIVNVKSPSKGRRLRDDLQTPIAGKLCPQVEFLQTIMQWLDHWESLKFDNGILTRETHSALRLTTEALVKIINYCLEDLGFDYVLLGKFQTDCLEERFGKYRQLSGSQYHVSIRQVFESERKLRLQRALALPDLDSGAPAVSLDEAILQRFNIEVNDKDFEMKAQNLPAITYVAGYCAHAALKKLACTACRANLVEDEDIIIENAEIISSMNRGGLKFPQPPVVNAVMTAEIVLDKLRSEKYAVRFHSLANQRQALFTLATNLIKDSDSFDKCESGHSPHIVMHHILSAATNILLKNYCKNRNDSLVQAKVAQKRKLNTLKS